MTNGNRDGGAGRRKTMTCEPYVSGSGGREERNGRGILVQYNGVDQINVIQNS